MKRIRTLAAALLLAASAAPALADPVSIVAAENFYGNVAAEIGGANVAVVSILSNPDQDPHLFEASPSTARQLADADIVILNGIDYDPWMAKLLAAGKAPQRQEIVVADLVGAKAGDNPHIWYDPATMKALAEKIAAELVARDDGHKSDYESGLNRFIESLAALDRRITDMKERYAGVPVTASEPVFGHMADLLGLDMRNQGFQLSVMNDTEPAMSDVAAFESDLRDGKVKAFFYNSQVVEPATERLLKLAESGGVPVIGVTETEPEGKTYAQWMGDELDALDKALAGARK